MLTKPYMPPFQRMVDLQTEQALLLLSGADDPGYDYNNGNDLGELE